MKSQIKVAVIGGGASGLMAAIAAREGGAEVIIIERNDKVGKKILVTGNGRCNLTNLDMNYDYYHTSGHNLLKTVLDAYPTERIMHLFLQMGLFLKDRNGYVYPYSDQAAQVLDVLRFRASVLGVTTVTGTLVTAVNRQENGEFVIKTNDSVYTADRVILCCGGMAAPRTGSDGSGYQLAKKLGHHVTALYPALTSLKAEGNFWKEIAGVRSYCRLNYTDSNQTFEEAGELQITDYGISGIPVFQLSGRIAELLSDHRRVRLSLAFLSEEDSIQIKERLKMRYHDCLHMTIGDFLTGVLHKKLTCLLIRLSGHSISDSVSETGIEDILRIVDSFGHFNINITSVNSFEQAQVTRGGIVSSEITDRLESVIVKGLYFAGEILDVDGLCGGYNLHWAFASGHYAGGNCLC